MSFQGYGVQLPGVKGRPLHASLPHPWSGGRGEGRGKARKEGRREGGGRGSERGGAVGGEGMRGAVLQPFRLAPETPSQAHGTPPAQPWESALFTQLRALPLQLL